MIIANLLSIRNKILIAQKRGSRSHKNVQLLAVSKTRPATSVQEAMEAGQMAFAENRVPEAIEKATALPNTIDWHFIGHIQKNKIRKILPVCKTLHSIDTFELAQQVNRIANEEDLHPKIYLEVNIAEDEAKFGFSADGIRRDLEKLLSLDRLKILGLMTIPKFSANPEDSRKHFAALRELGQSLGEQSGVPLEGLSMGMSNDYEIAIEEGATVIRVGTEIFGPRDNAG